MTAAHPTLALLESLVTKQGVTLGRMSREQLLLTLGFASLSIPQDQPLSEAEVNQALRHWLAGDGVMLRIDPVELRRSLIDLGLWTRDGYGRAYVRPLLAEDHPARSHVAGMAAIDLPAFVAEARAKRDRQRAERQAAYAGKP